MIIPEEVCKFNRNIATSFLYLLPEIMSVLSGIASVAVITYSFFLYGFRLLFHFNAKILMILLTIFILIFSIDVIYVCTRQVYMAFTYENDCDLVFETAYCTVFRRVALTCFVGVTTTQFSQMVERFIATVWKEKYEFQTQWLGGLFLLFSILSAILVIEWTLWNENPLEPMTHCLAYSASESIGGRVYIVFFAILAVDLFILTAFCGLYYSNQMKKITAALNKKYQQHENLVVLRALFPMVFLNTIFVSTYILTALVVRSFRNSMSVVNYKLFAINTFIFPYVSLLLAVTILITTRNEFRRRQQRKLKPNRNVTTQDYFNQYQRQWNVISDRK